MLDDKIRAAVEPLVAVCVPDLYIGDETEYCTYNYKELPRAFGDNRPYAILYLVQVHWFLPLKRRPKPKKRKLGRALASMPGLVTWPTVADATDEAGQHYVYEFQAMEGIDDGKAERKRAR